MIDYTPLTKIMKKHNYNFLKLKNITGLSDASLRAAVYEGKYINTDSLDKICKALDCDIKDIITWRQGPQKAIGKPEMVFIDWDLLESRLKIRNQTISSGSVKILGKSINYLTRRRAEDKPIYLSDAKLLARFCHLLAYDIIKENAE